MFIKRLASVAWVAAFALLSAGPARAAAPPADIMAVVNGVVAATNADSAQRVGRYFSADAVIADDTPPFVWAGPDAGVQWWNTVHADLARMHSAHLHATMRPIARYHLAGDSAYVVVPLSLAVTASGKTQHILGLWTMTLRRAGGSWKITTASFADE
jgi:ketosteroid isomerase-like protein